MLPEAQNRPTCLIQQHVESRVTAPVGTDLLRPVLGVGLGGRVVLQTAMPKATVDKDSNLRSREHKVGSKATVTREWREVHAVPETCGVDSATHRDFWLGVSASVCAHGGPNPVRRGP